MKEPSYTRIEVRQGDVRYTHMILTEQLTQTIAPKDIFYSLWQDAMQHVHDEVLRKLNEELGTCKKSSV